jgi:hypothetical protein
MKANSTGGQGSRRAVVPSDDDDGTSYIINTDVFKLYLSKVCICRHCCDTFPIQNGLIQEMLIRQCLHCAS